ncbi:MAG TPA: UDP-glucose/GDP-mannose dehydrogenase family protein [Acidimicrobiales bacterium]|nr:UDP-glucose/GDP-mannose dehydrogenase family protein [Acidimicrobiales bacterium]
MAPLSDAPDPTNLVVAVIGAGYVGLTTAVCLSHLGYRVCCGELDDEKVQHLQRGEPTILEDGLADLLREGLASKRLRFVTGAKAAVQGASFVFLCVPTPQRPDGSADVDVLESVAREIGPHLAHGAVVVNKSTVPVGSALLVEQLLDRPGISVVSNPEFLREGTAVHDCLHPERIVVGSDDQAAAARVGALFAATQAPLIVTDAATAETIKYASNAFLATKLSFVNAVANMCEAVGADVRDVLLGMAYDHRIGFDYLRPGPGWGGSCLPKDTRALLFMAESGGYEFPLLREVIQTNETQLSTVMTKIRHAVGGSLQGRRLAAWGLTFKARTDDRRDSPAVEIVRRMVAEGALVRAFDPTVAAAIPELPQSVEICADAYAACDGAAAVVVLTEWDELRWLDFAKVRTLLEEPSVIDARNLLDPLALRRMGFSYSGVGRP